MSAPVKGRAKAGSHRLTEPEYTALLAAQGGHCALCPSVPGKRHRWVCRYCKTPNRADAEACASCEKARPVPQRLHTDRDHRTGEVRGLLCMRCNRNLPAWVTSRWCLAAAAYLDDGTATTAVIWQDAA